MGLKQDIFNAFESTMVDKSNGEKLEVGSVAHKNTTKLAEDLKNAFIDFLTKQTFRVVEIDAPLVVDKIATPGALSSIQKPIAKTNSYADGTVPVTSAPGSPSAVKNIAVPGGSKVEIEKLHLTTDGTGQGGSLEVNGSAVYKAASTPSAVQGDGLKSVVKLFRGDIKNSGAE